MATTAMIAGAVIGAAGNYMSSREANKPRTARTDQTTTQNPYWGDTTNLDIGQIINAQRGIAARGAPIVDRNGNVTYAPLPDPFNPGALGISGGVAPPAGINPAPAGGGGGGAGARRPAAAKPAAGGGGGGGDWFAALSPAEQKRVNKMPAAEFKRYAAQQKAAFAGSGGARPAGGGAAAAPQPTSAEDFLRAAGRGGLAAGNTETIGQSRNAIGNILGAAGGGGPETTGFEGYNPILDRLAGTLEGDVNQRVSRDLLLDFLGENNRAGGGSSTSGGGGPVGYNIGSPGGGGAGGGSTGSGAVPTSFAQSQGWFGPKPAATPGTAPGGGVPDTMAVQSYFGDETRKVMDEPANQAELEELIRLMNEDVEKGQFRDLAALDAAAQGSGRFGGDMWKGMSRDAREEALQEMAQNAAGVRVGDRESRRQARLAALSGVNARDLGLLSANVQREGIAAGERSASASAGAASAAAADQLALARRGQDLSALGALMDYEQFGVGQLGDIGSQLSSDRINALGLVPGLEGIGLSGLNVALGTGEGLAGIRANEANAANARAGIGLQQRGMNQQLGQFNAMQQQNLLNDYLRTIGAIGGMGGTSHTVGTNVQPGLGVSPAGAAFTGALGGAASGAGLYGMYGGGGYTNQGTYAGTGNYKPPGGKG